MTENTPPPALANAHRAVAVLAVMFAAALAGLFLGAHGRAFASVGMLVIPLALLAMLAYAGEHARWARVSAVVLLLLIAVLIAAGFTGQAEQLLDTRAVDADRAERLLTWIRVISGAGIGVAALTFLGPMRRAAGRVLPMDRDRFVHAVALAATLTLCISSFAPLIVLGEPPLTALAALDREPDAAGSSLYEHAYQLLWLVPACVLIVGYGMRRTLRQCLERLGLTAPTLRQVLRAAGLAVGLVVMAGLLGWLVDSLWTELGLQVTDKSGVDRLMGDIISPMGALVVGVSAGLGEELLVRGALQPRLGIVLSNLLFTALHAAQYGSDLLVVIFGLGLCFGLIRKYTSTTESVMAHTFYDMLIILAAFAAA